MNKFEKWAADMGGPRKLSEMLGVTHWAVKFWLKKKGYPQVETIEKIIKLSKGRLTFADIVAGCR